MTMLQHLGSFAAASPAVLSELGLEAELGQGREAVGVTGGGSI